MKRYHFYVLTFICTQLSFGYVSTAWAKADCELKQLVTADEFKMLQEKWKVTSPLPIAEKDYSQLKSNEIYFYDTKSSLFKTQAILRWRKKDGEQGTFTIKDRFGALVQPNAECQNDYTSKNTTKKSCQFDNDSPGFLPQKIKFSKDQKLFLKANSLKWEPSEIVPMGPIYSYKTEADASVCEGLGAKKPIEFESWLMKDNKQSRMLFEISVKINGNDKKCGNANTAFRNCLHKLGIDVDSDRGTKTEAVYTFLGN